MRIFVRKKKLYKIMLKLREKYREKKEALPDDSSMEIIIKESMAEDD